MSAGRPQSTEDGRVCLIGPVAMVLGWAQLPAGILCDMASPATQAIRGTDSAEVELTNIGPLAHAKFTVSPLTLFVGQNGAGKTLAATFLYVLQKAIWSACQDLRQTIVAGMYLLGGSEATFFRPPGEDSDAAASWVRRAIEQIERHLSSEKFRSSLESAFEAEVTRALVDPAAFVRNRYRVGHFAIEHENGWSCSARCPVKGGIKTTWHLPAIKMRPSLPTQFERASYIFWSSFCEEALSSVFGSWCQQPIMVPTGRAGITDSYRYLASQVLLEHPGTSGPGIAGITRDFLAMLVRIDPQPFPGQRDAGGQDDIVESLFDVLLRGRLKPSPERDELFTFEVEGRKIDRCVLSSMVKELGPVIVLLQRSALSGAALAIDEPECSLHPQAQVELAKVLVELVSRDARFLLSTHSPYLAQSLSNEWVRRSREGSLSGKSMSVVSFANSGKGFGAKSLQYHESYGFEFEEFVDTADSVQSQFAELFE